MVDDGSDRPGGAVGPRGVRVALRPLRREDRQEPVRHSRARRGDRRRPAGRRPDEPLL